MKTPLTLIALFTLIISQAYLPPLSAQWIPYEIDANAGDVRVLMTGDMDGDGDLDITANAYLLGNISWYENDIPTWKKHPIDTGIAGPIISIPADIDGDGDLDIVTQGNGENKVFWYENDHPTWTQHVIDPMMRGAETVDVADIDGDGDFDVVAVGWISGYVVWYENDNLTWHEYTIDNDLVGAANVAFADIDGDNDLDVVATGGNADDVVWYENNLPSNVWNKSTIDANLDRAWKFDIEDIDGDGDDDVAVPGRDADVVNWYENDSLTWHKHTIDSSFDEAAVLFIANFDKDDKPDIVATSYGVGVLKWYKNNLPTWEENIIDANSGFLGLGVGDIDGDDILDVIAGNMSTGTLWWYHNKTKVAQVKSMQCQPSFISSQGDTLIITAQLYNPENHPATAQAIISGEIHSFTDSIQLYDDGQHHDGLPSDNIWGNSKWLSGLPEDTYSIGISTHDIAAEYIHYFPPTPSFTTIGPVTFHHYEMPQLDANSFKFKLCLINKGSTVTAASVSAVVSTSDTNITNDPGTFYFIDIAPGEVNTSLSFPHRIDTQNNPDSMDFIVNIFSNGYFFWIDSFTVTITGITENEPNSPMEYALKQNYPNPFNPSTMINYQLPIASDVKLSIYNILGQRVATLFNERQKAGHHQVEWDASGFSSGIYYYRIEAGEFKDVKKMVLLR